MLPDNKIKNLLEIYISNLDGFFSLDDKVDKKKLRMSGKELSNSYTEFKSICFEQRLDQIAKTNEKVREEIQSLLPLAEKIKNIKKVNAYEKQLINSINIYIMARITLFGKSFQEVVQKALNDSEVSLLLESFVKSQRRQKYLVALSFTAVAITLLGLFPPLSIPMAVVSIGMFFWEGKTSESELKKLKKIGREVKANGLSEINRISDSVNKLVDFSDYVKNIKTETHHEIDSALKKLENNERLDLSSITKLTSLVTDNLNKMNTRFGLQ